MMCVLLLSRIQSILFFFSNKQIDSIFYHKKKNIATGAITHCVNHMNECNLHKKVIMANLNHRWSYLEVFMIPHPQSHATV